MSIEQLEDKELFDQLNKAGLADKLVNQEEWRLLKEAARRIVDRAVDEFALKADPSNLTHITELKTVIRKYKYGLFREVEILKSESERLFEEAKDRGMIGGESNRLT